MYLGQVRADKRHAPNAARNTRLVFASCLCWACRPANKRRLATDENWSSRHRAEPTLRPRSDVDQVPATLADAGRHWTKVVHLWPFEDAGPKLRPIIVPSQGPNSMPSRWTFWSQPRGAATWIHPRKKSSSGWPQTGRAGERGACKGFNTQWSVFHRLRPTRPNVCKILVGQGDTLGVSRFSMHCCAPGMHRYSEREMPTSRLRQV